MKKRYAAIIILAIGSQLFGCGALNRQVETAMLPTPKDYEKAKYVQKFTIAPREAYLTRMVWEGESIDNWTVAIEIFNTWKKNFPPNSMDAYKQLVEKRKKMCPEVIFNVISHDNNSILYEINTINCPPNPDENSINRILYGNTDVFNLIYTNKVKVLPKETRDEWIRVLSGTVIETMNY